MKKLVIITLMFVFLNHSALFAGKGLKIGKEYKHIFTGKHERTVNGIPDKYESKNFRVYSTFKGLSKDVTRHLEVFYKQIKFVFPPSTLRKKHHKINLYLITRHIEHEYFFNRKPDIRCNGYASGTSAWMFLIKNRELTYLVYRSSIDTIQHEIYHTLQQRHGCKRDINGKYCRSLSEGGAVLFGKWDIDLLKSQNFKNIKTFKNEYINHIRYVSVKRMFNAEERSYLSYIGGETLFSYIFTDGSRRYKKYFWLSYNKKITSRVTEELEKDFYKFLSKTGKKIVAIR